MQIWPFHPRWASLGRQMLPVFLMILNRFVKWALSRSRRSNIIMKDSKKGQDVKQELVMLGWEKGVKSRSNSNPIVLERVSKHSKDMQAQWLRQRSLISMKRMLLKTLYHESFMQIRLWYANRLGLVDSSAILLLEVQRFIHQMPLHTPRSLVPTIILGPTLVVTPYLTV